MNIVSTGELQTALAHINQASPKAPRNAATPSSESSPLNSESTGDPSLKAVEQAVAKLQERLKPFAQQLEFSVNTETKQMVVKVIDSADGRVLRQFPSKEIIAVAADIDKILKGHLVTQTA